jgi:hypothetical protein
VVGVSVEGEGKTSVHDISPVISWILVKMRRVIIDRSVVLLYCIIFIGVVLPFLVIIFPFVVAFFQLNFRILLLLLLLRCI